MVLGQEAVAWGLGEKSARDDVLAREAREAEVGMGD